MLGRFMRRYGWQYIPGVVFLLLSSYISALAPIVLGNAIDGLRVVPIDRAYVFRQVANTLWIALGVFATRFIWRYFIIGNARNMEVFLREELFAKLQRLPVTFFDHAKTGDLMAYAINDVGAVRMTFGPAISMFLSGISTTSFAVFTMLNNVDPHLTFYALLPLPIALIAILLLGNQVRARFRRVQELFATVSGRVQENITGMRVLKAFVQEEAQTEHFEILSEDMRKANMDLTKTSAAINPIVTVCFGVSYMIMMILGGRMVQRGEISLGSFVAFNGYLAMITMPVISMGRIVNLVQRGLASMRRLNGILDEPSIPEDEYREWKNPIKGGIRFDHLSFSYEGSQEAALDDISLELLPGQVLGICGATGCGKSTLAYLLMKLYSAPPESVYIDGQDVRSIPATAIRDAIGYVPQDGFLFNTSIHENIIFFTPNRDESDVQRMVELCGLEGEIANFPEGIETEVGERGNHLSGGQKQRVSIARAMIRDPRILILDDSLSAVDVETEKRILNNMQTVLHDRTALIIAHRLSAIEHADLIVFMENGRIIERGNHESLMALGGQYATTYTRQMSESVKGGIGA